MTKKSEILIHAAITPIDGASSKLDAVQAALSQFCTELINSRPMDLKPAAHLPKHVWVFVSSQEDDPYVQVAEPFEQEGELISDYALQKLREEGVCTKVYGEYPRADKYGAPLAATSDDAAAAIAAEHLFAVAEEGVDVNLTDRGDDGGETYWLCIALAA